MPQPPVRHPSQAAASWVILLVLLLTLPALADIVVCKDGTRIEGRIVEESAAHLVVQQADGTPVYVIKAQIESIQRTDPPPAPATPAPDEAPPPPATPTEPPAAGPADGPADEPASGIEVPDNLSIPEDHGLRSDALALYEKGARLVQSATEAEDGTERAAQARAAIPLLIQARRKERDFHQAYYQLGIAHQLAGDDAKARPALERAIALRPDFYEAMVELGDVLNREASFAEAKALYDQALSINPSYAQAYKMRAFAAMQMRLLEQAKADVDRALELEPEDKVALQVKEALEKELKGPEWDETFRHVSDHYEVISNVSQEETEKIAAAAEEAYAIYDILFASGESVDIKFKIEVYAKPQDYFDAGFRKGTAGMYNDGLKKLALYQHPDWENTLSVIYHEGFHQYLDMYLDRAPMWFNEGHADFFGWCRRQNQTLVPRPHPWRLDAIQRALRGSGEQPLKELLLFDRRRFYDPRIIGMNYAQAWSFTYFLWTYRGGVYRKLLATYYKGLRKGASQEQAYRSVFASRIDRLESEWRTYTRELELTAEDRALLKQRERPPEGDR